MKVKKLFIILITCMMLVLPVNVLGASKNYNYNYNYSYSNATNYNIIDNINILDGDNKVTTDTLGLCDDPRFLKLLKYIKTLISLVMYATAIALVASCIMALVKELTSDKAEVDKAIKTVGSKIVLAIIVFLLPTLVNWIFFTDNFITQRSNFLQTCTKNMNDPDFFSNYAGN